MMSIDYGFLANPSLPDRDTIMALCNQHGYMNGTGIPLHDADSNAIIAWVKYGPYVTIDEARTQDFAAKELARIPDSKLRAPRVFDAFQWQRSTFMVGCVVMEYIDGSDCHKSGDVRVVANAVQILIGIRGPDLTPGHIGSGNIVHPFFFDGVANVHYTSVTDLQDHINGILKYMGDKRRVDIVSEAEGGLFLCPCDIDRGNFRRRSTDGQLFAIDFWATCLLPPSFFALAMSLSDNRFCQRVARKVKYEEPECVSAMAAASGYLVQFGVKPIGLPSRLRDNLKRMPYQ